MKRIDSLVLALVMCGLMAGVGLAQDTGTTDEPQQLQLRELNYADAPGLDANGGIHRNGADFVGEGGPHGSAGMSGETDKIFIDEDGDGFCDLQGTGDGDGVGDMLQLQWQHRWSGEQEAGQGTGEPHGGSAFGPGDGTGDGTGDCDGTSSATISQVRQGRR